jgi:hypothetical protein
MFILYKNGINDPSRPIRVQPGPDRPHPRHSLERMSRSEMLPKIHRLRHHRSRVLLVLRGQKHHGTLESGHRPSFPFKKGNSDRTRNFQKPQEPPLCYYTYPLRDHA